MYDQLFLNVLAGSCSRCSGPARQCRGQRIPIEGYGNSIMIHQHLNGAKNARRPLSTVHRTVRRGADSSTTIATNRDIRTSRQRNAFPSENESLDSWHRSTLAYGFVAPSQFFTPPQRSHMMWRGEQRLLLAVLQEALACWVRYRDVPTIRGRRLFSEVATWFESPDKGWLYAFEHICEFLDFDPDYVRLGLRRWKSTASIPQTLSNGVRRRATSRLPPGTTGKQLPVSSSKRKRNARD